MYNNDNRKTYDFYEDWDDNAAGRAMLKMDWLWDEEEYPQKKAATVPDDPAIPAAEISGGLKPQPDPFRQQTRIDNFDTSPALAALKNPLPASDTAEMTQTFTKNVAGLKPRPDAWQEFTRSQALKPVTPQPNIFPYNDIGQLTSSASSKVIENVIEPTVQKLKQTVKDKKPVELLPEKETGENWTPIKDRQNIVATPEADLVGTSKAVTDAAGKAYTQKNVTDALFSIHAGDTLGHENDMANPNDDFVKGTAYTSREKKVSERATEQVFNKIFSPESTNTKELGAWLKKEEAWLENNPLPELRDFSRINWKENPDKVLELGGKYFRQTFLGSHAYGLALSMIDSRGKKGNPILNQQIDQTMTGIARIYCQMDELLQAASTYGTAGKPAEGWDFLVGRATAKLPLVSREGLRFLNRFLTQEMKEKMFLMVTEGVRTDTGRLDGSIANRQEQEPPAILPKKQPYQFKK